MKKDEERERQRQEVVDRIRANERRLLAATEQATQYRRLIKEDNLKWAELMRTIPNGRVFRIMRSSILMEVTGLWHTQPTDIASNSPSEIVYELTGVGGKTVITANARALSDRKQYKLVRMKPTPKKAEDTSWQTF